MSINALVTIEVYERNGVTVDGDYSLNLTPHSGTEHNEGENSNFVVLTVATESYAVAIDELLSALAAIKHINEVR